MLRKDLRAGCVSALAGNFYFFGACVFAPVAAKFLARWNIAIAGFVGALPFLVHVLLLHTHERGTRLPKSGDATPQWLPKCLAGPLRRERPEKLERLIDPLPDGHPGDHQYQHTGGSAEHFNGETEPLHTNL